MSRILGARGPFRSWLRHSNISIRTRFSLASRIQSFLPDLDENTFEKPQKPTAKSRPIPTLLAANEYLDATKAFVSNASVDNFDNELQQQVLSYLNSPFSVQEIQYCLSQLNLEALITDQRVIAEISLLNMLSQATFDPNAWDELCLRGHGINYPQILWSPKSSLWLKTRLMQLILERTHEEYARKILSRYIGQLQGYEPISYLVQSKFGLVAQVVFENQDESHFLAVLNGTTSQTFKTVWQKIKSRKIKTSQVLKLALRKALHFNKTFEIAHICKYEIRAFESPLLSRALLAVAWGQKKEGDDSSFTTAAHANTALIESVLQSIGETRVQRVFHFALQTQPPPNILWALLIAWDKVGFKELQEHISAKIATLLVDRPHLEQLRYMALKSTSNTAISQLLKLNINRVHANRKAANIEPHVMIAEADMKLLVGGMVLMSEKKETETASKPLCDTVDELFKNWTPEDAEGVVSTLYEVYRPSPQVTLAMVGMLLRHQSYTQAVQLINIHPTSDLPPKIFHRLLLQVCKDFPEISSILTTWLTSVVRVYLPPSVLQQMIILLSKQRTLSDRQSMLRINSVIKLLRGQRASPGPQAAAAIVDGLLDRAMKKPGGSRKRLQWALDICQEEKVPQAKVKEWVERINSMRSNAEGYWWNKGRK